MSPVITCPNVDLLRCHLWLPVHLYIFCLHVTCGYLSIYWHVVEMTPMVTCPSVLMLLRCHLWLPVPQVHCCNTCVVTRHACWTSQVSCWTCAYRCAVQWNTWSHISSFIVTSPHETVSLETTTSSKSVTSVSPGKTFFYMVPNWAVFIYGS